MVKDLEKKQFLTYDEQITFLEEKKGLMISDKEYAKKILLKIGYFPLRLQCHGGESHNIYQKLL